MINKVVYLTDRLQNGRVVETEADYRQWLYEYLTEFTRDIGMDHVPAQIFPIIVRVMVEWAEVIRDFEIETNGGGGVETAQALADAVSKLSDCLKRHLALMR